MVFHVAFFGSSVIGCCDVVFQTSSSNADMSEDRKASLSRSTSVADEPFPAQSVSILHVVCIQSARNIRFKGDGLHDSNFSMFDSLDLGNYTLNIRNKLAWSITMLWNTEVSVFVVQLTVLISVLYWLWTRMFQKVVLNLLLCIYFRLWRRLESWLSLYTLLERVARVSRVRSRTWRVATHTWNNALVNLWSSSCRS